MSPSKLTIIRQFLESNPNAVIVATREKTYFPEGMKDRSGTIHFFYFRVAPRQGLYTPEGLEEFMLGLIPVGLEPSYVYKPFVRRDNFTGRTGENFYFGDVDFNETVGRSTHTYTLTDEELLNAIGYENRVSVIEGVPAKRRITVKSYPDQAIAKHFAESNSEETDPEGVDIMPYSEVNKGGGFFQQLRRRIP